jgi:hypothetical protein
MTTLRKSGRSPGAAWGRARRSILVVLATASATTAGCGKVQTVPSVEGEGVPVVLAANQNSPSAIAVDATSVYWAAGGTEANGFSDDTVMQMPVGGGSPAVLASGQQGISGIAVDVANVYWTNAGTEANANTDGSVARVPASGGAPVTLASGLNAPARIVAPSRTEPSRWSPRRAVPR